MALTRPSPNVAITIATSGEGLLRFVPLLASRVVRSRHPDRPNETAARQSKRCPQPFPLPTGETSEQLRQRKFSLKSALGAGRLRRQILIERGIKGQPVSLQ